MALAGKDAQLRLKTTTLSNATDLDVISSTLDEERDQSEIPQYGDEGQRRLYLLQDNTIEFEVDIDATAKAGIAIVENAIQDEDNVRVNYSPDGQGGGPNKVYDFVGQIEALSYEIPSDDAQILTVTIINSDGNEMEIDSSFQI